MQTAKNFAIFSSHLELDRLGWKMPQQFAEQDFDVKNSLKKPIRWALTAGLIVAFISIFLPNEYRSVARLLPVEAKGAGGFSGLVNTATALGMGLPGTEGPDASYVDILKSRWIKEKLIQTMFAFPVRSWRFGSSRHHEETLYTYLNQPNMDRALSALDQILVPSRDPKSKVITISVETRSPELSQMVVRRTTELLNSFLVQNARTRGGDKAAFAASRLVEARREMDQAEDEFRIFLESSRNFQGSADPVVRLRGARLEAELNLRRQLVTTLALHREQALLEAKNDMPILNVLDAGNLPIEKSKPARSYAVLVVTFLTGVGSWLWQNRERVRAILLSNDDNVDKASKE